MKIIYARGFSKVLRKALHHGGFKRLANKFPGSLWFIINENVCIKKLLLKIKRYLLKIVR